jgi:transposase-like protein
MSIEAELSINGAGGENAEGARRANEAFSPPAARPATAGQRRPDPEVAAKARRRRFTAEYKERILAEADRCAQPGAIGALLRREGLYSSHVQKWRQQRRVGLQARTRGRPPERNPLGARVAQLERENARLRSDLEKAEIIIDVQKKVATLLGKDAPSGSGS